jgi:hypothetical protein
MKTVSLNIVTLLLIMGFLVISLDGNSQSSKPDKQERKALKEAQANANFYFLDSLLASRRFVLEADYLQNKIGDMISVSPVLNFVKADGSKGILQTGSDMLVGYNGTGGVTTEGNTSEWKISGNHKSLIHRVSFNLVSSLGVFNIDMTVNSDFTATAIISNNTSGKLTWRGDLVTIHDSRVFKGMETY